MFLLIYVVWCVGYDKRGLFLWMAIAWVLLTVCYAYMPPPSPVKDPVTKKQIRDPNLPVNINYVYGLKGDEKPQTEMEPNWYFAVYMMILMAVVYPGTHLLCAAVMPRPHGVPTASS